MKILFILLFSMMSATAFSQSMKVVVDSAGNVVGRYVRTNADTYTVGVQDIFDVPKNGKRVVEYNASKGQGVIWCKKVGCVDVYSQESKKSEIIGQLIYEDGYVPETYPCLGKKHGWYKVKINDKEGYVSAKLVEWDAISTF